MDGECLISRLVNGEQSGTFGFVLNLKVSIYLN